MRTVVDSGVCHSRNNDFYLCAQAGTLGTTRPTHYQVLCDEIGCTASEIHELVGTSQVTELSLWLLPFFTPVAPRPKCLKLPKISSPVKIRSECLHFQDHIEI
ncbi:hypothetical protein OROMI_032191 [Orobanche minor]